MGESYEKASATIRDFDDGAMGQILDRILTGSAGYFAGTTPAAVESAVERLQTLAFLRGVRLAVTREGEMMVVRRGRHNGHEGLNKVRPAA